MDLHPYYLNLGHYAFELHGFEREDDAIWAAMKRPDCTSLERVSKGRREVVWTLELGIAGE